MAQPNRPRVLIGLIVCLLPAGCANPLPTVVSEGGSGLLGVEGRAPAAHHGILIAQAEALTAGHAYCATHNGRFLAVRSIAAENKTGTALFALAFVCLNQAGTAPLRPEAGRLSPDVG